MKPKPWHCKECDQSIASGKGYIVIADAETNGYPSRREQEPSLPITGDVIADMRVQMRDGVTLAQPVPPPPIRIDAYHVRCDPAPHKSQYWIRIEDADTLEKWCSLVHHLCEKTWMEPETIQLAIRFWFANRGVSVHTLKQAR